MVRSIGRRRVHPGFVIPLCLAPRKRSLRMLSEHRLGALLKGAWVVVALGVVTLGGCKKAPTPLAKGDGLVGIHIPAHHGIPALEVAVQTRPKIADSLVANTLSRLLLGAFSGCADKVDVKKSFPMQLEFSGQGGVLKTHRKGAGPLERCLFAALEGKALAKWSGNPRVRVQLRPLAHAKK